MEIGVLFNLSMLQATIRMATPLTFAALGGMFCERAVVNIGLEGIMLNSAFWAVFATHFPVVRESGFSWSAFWNGIGSNFSSSNRKILCRSDCYRNRNKYFWIGL